VGYIRVSTTKDGCSLDAQRAKITAYCAVSNIRLTAIHSDQISGATITNRPGVQAAIAEACRQHCPLIVYSLSRLVRSVADAIVVGDRLARAHADLVSLSENIDTSTASGRLVFKLLALLGEFERELIVERTQTVVDNMRREGRRLSRFAPYGFDLAGDYVTPNDREQGTIALMQRLRTDGWSYDRISDHLNDQGVPSKLGGGWSGRAVRLVLARTAKLAAA